MLRARRVLLSTANRFSRALARHRAPAPVRRTPSTLQVNLGKVCNQACRHCHVDAGPQRTEAMDERTVRRVLEVVAANPCLDTIDITGGAPELNSHFRALATGCRQLGRKVIVRCNLTVLSRPGQSDTAEFHAANELVIIASLPCYTADNVDRQRGGGVFEQSLAALRRLNGLGYGAAAGDENVAGLRLHLVYNPLGPHLPPAQDRLEEDYRRRLWNDFGIVFDRLFTLANMPIHRFAEDLERQGRGQEYEDLLEQAFNAAALDGLMCRDLISVDWDGRLSDCDFNQMLGLPLGAAAGSSNGNGTAAGPTTIFELRDVAALARAPITTADHCLGCTAGQGSSCGGALAASR